VADQVHGPRGKMVDKRADIWAFGVVLYEMLTSKQLFHGDTVSDVLAAVLKEEPDLTLAPPQVHRLLQSCLQKDPKQRLPAIGDYPLLLADAPSQPAPSWSRLKIGASFTAGVLLIALGIVSFIHFRETPAQKTLLRYTIAAPENTSFIHSFAISPDGRYLAISATVKGKFQLWLRAIVRHFKTTSPERLYVQVAAVLAVQPVWQRYFPIKASDDTPAASGVI